MQWAGKHWLPTNTNPFPNHQPVQTIFPAPSESTQTYLQNLLKHDCGVSRRILFISVVQPADTTSVVNNSSRIVLLQV